MTYLKKNHPFHFSYFIFFIFSLFFLTSCSNFLKLLSNKSTDQAIFQEIQILIKKSQCEKSLSYFEKLSESFQEEKKVQLLKSKAYACICGLNFVSLISRMISQSNKEEEGEEEEKTLFQFLVTQFKGATSDQIEACTQAYEIVFNIEDEPHLRSTDENLYLSYLFLVNIGVILNHTSDTDNNDEIDPSFNACNKDSISDELVLNIGNSVYHSARISDHLSETLDEEDEAAEEIKEPLERNINPFDSVCEDLDIIQSDHEDEEVSIDLCEESEEKTETLYISILRIFINESFQIQENENCIPENN